MKEGKASYTAEVMAIRRAVESMRPESERVCYDPLAVNFIRTQFRIIGRSRLLTRMAVWYADERRVPGGFGYVVARVRYIDDYLKTCMADGIGQLVILGAGYDTRPYRFDELKGRAKVFEVDHADTQKTKMEKLRKMFGSLPDHVVYVPIDFNKDKLDKRLYESGYDRNLKTLFIWEGVTYYIPAEAVDETLSFVANNSGEGSSIVFDYLVESDEYEKSEQLFIERVQKIHKRIGELLIFGIPNGTIEEFLSRRGFCQIENASVDYLKKAYFNGRNQRRKVFASMAIVHATVKPRG